MLQVLACILYPEEHENTDICNGFQYHIAITKNFWDQNGSAH
jgi:hypothetical protein